MKNNKMKLTLRVMAPSSLIWRLKTYLMFLTMKLIALEQMMDEVMVSRCTPLLLL